MKKSYKIFLGLIVLLGFFIRVVGIADLETGFYVDEASLGYNAKSIWETGSDEYGQKLPLSFRSFGDFKTPLFVYASIPFVVMFGEVVGIRLSSAIFGVLTIWLVAELARKLSGDKAGIFAGLILCLLPWHVNLSRHGIEATLAGVMLAGALLLLVKRKYRSGLLILAFSTLAYHSTKYISPLIAVSVVIKLWFDRKDIKWKGWGWVLVGVVWLGALFIILQPYANTRALGVRQIFQVRNMVAAYVSYFSPRMLVVGDWQLRNSIYGISNVSILVIILFYIGVWRAIKIFKARGNNFDILLIFITLVLCPLPATATIDPFHTIRAMVMVVPLSVLAGIGGAWLFEKIKLRFRVLVVMTIVLISFYQGLLLFERVLVQNKLMSYEQWTGGYQQLVDSVMKLDTTYYNQIVADITDEPATYSLWQVFGKVDTKQKIPLINQIPYYQPLIWHGPESLILRNGQEVYFKKVYWPEDQKKPNTLYVGSVWRFDPDAIKRAGAKVMVEIKDPTGKVVWMAVATKNNEIVKKP